MEWLLTAAILGLMYPYLIYPPLLAVVSRICAHPAAASVASPRVAILVSAFNEEDRIEKKIENFDALDYPADRLEMWIGVDGATDRTAEKVRHRAHPRVRLVERSERSGKTAVLNDLASRARADVLVFTDVNASFRADAVHRLVAPLMNDQVGLVSGRTIIRASGGNVDVEGAYYRLETWLKAREGACGWLAGADGAIYALQTRLYRTLSPEIINDLAHPCQVVAEGFQARFEPLAVSEETPGEDAVREFERQTRIAAQASYLLTVQCARLLLRRRWGMLWVLVSHKWMRWLAGLWLLAGAIALGSLAPRVALIVLAGLLALSFASKLPLYFLLIHLAYLRGLWRALRGERYVMWRPRSG